MNRGASSQQPLTATGVSYGSRSCAIDGGRPRLQPVAAGGGVQLSRALEAGVVDGSAVASCADRPVVSLGRTTPAARMGGARAFSALAAH